MKYKSINQSKTQMHACAVCMCIDIHTAYAYTCASVYAHEYAHVCMYVRMYVLRTQVRGLCASCVMRLLCAMHRSWYLSVVVSL